MLPLGRTQLQWPKDSPVLGAGCVTNSPQGAISHCPVSLGVTKELTHELSRRGGDTDLLHHVSLSAPLPPLEPNNCMQELKEHH